MTDLRNHRRNLALLERRGLIRGGVSLGSLGMLAGCDLSSDDATDRALRWMLRFNDRVQGWLFDRRTQAEEFPADRITRPPRFNAYYPEYQVRTVDPDAWKLEIGGLVQDRTALGLADFRKMPQSSQITRHICVEGWSQIGQWSGVKLSHVLSRIGADRRAKYVGFKCFDDYWTSIDMQTAMQDQTILALDFDGGELDPPFGAPMRLRMPTKLGYKSAKYLSAMFVTNTYPGGYWENQGYDWFGGS